MDEKDFAVLDIGCGTSPNGDVNIDILRKAKIENFILADAQNLPFKEKAFQKAVVHHVLEHVMNPLSVIKETKRVACVTEISVPSPFFEPFEGTDTHIYTWNIHTFNHLLRCVFKNRKVWYSEHRFRIQGRLGRYLFLLNYLINRFPNEIKAVCW